MAGATPYLRMMATTTAGYMMARSALAALDGGGDLNPEFAAAKVATARFFCEQLMPMADGLLAAVTAGAEPLTILDPVALAR